MTDRIVYNKAIRDRIPEIIRKDGQVCSIETLDDASFLPFLEEKLAEEVDEYRHSGEIEELADLIEVIRRVAELRGRTMGEIEEIRSQKEKERGGFQENIVLRFVEETKQSGSE